ncbi:hypothetical protein C8J56DRAFT_863494 [Mycena floridula]|nr:hypothetical protein C8J56DRAFT_863494 [Mycena floridula]
MLQDIAQAQWAIVGCLSNCNKIVFHHKTRSGSFPSVSISPSFSMLFCILAFWSTGALGALTQKPQQAGLNFTEVLSLPTFTSQVLPLTPDRCASFTGVGKECTATMTATNISYADCGAPFTICRCSDAEISLGVSIDTLGRVPIGLRRYFETIMVMAGGSLGAHAYTFPVSGEAHFFGNCLVNTWIHEATHAADGALGITADDVGGAWAQAVASDTCVPDAYAQTNIVEDLAQMSVLKIYLLLNNNQMPAGFSAACMSNQLAVLDGLALYDSSTMFGNTCAFDPPAQHNVAAAGATSSEASSSQMTSTPDSPSATSSAEQLVLPSYKYQVLDSIPDLCAAYTGPDKECTATMVATNVTYDDCGAPYTVCRCSDAQVSILDAMDTLGKVPIGLRRYFGTIMVMSGPVGAYTFPLSGEAHFFGDCGVNTWIHEVRRSIFSYDVGGAWAQAVAADTCVPDAYAQNNIVEDFAQVSVLKIYLLLNNNQMPTGFEAACMSNQLAVVNGLTLYDNSTMFGNTCAFDPPAEYVEVFLASTLFIDAVIQA